MNKKSTLTKKLFIGFNWKMNPGTLIEAKALLDCYSESTTNANSLKPVLFVPSLFISFLQNQISSMISLGSQDISDQPSGAFTAQISGSMLNSMDCRYTLVAHSETRRDYKMKDKIIKQKLIQAIINNITPILCISFNHIESAKKELILKLESTFTPDLVEIIQNQTKQNFGNRQQPVFIIALEPIDNIGTGSHLDTLQIEKLLCVVDQFLGLHNLHKVTDQLTGDWIGDYISLYGGSVNSQNIKIIGECSNVDGFLIGSAGLIKSEIKNILSI